jgi:hypothetical protein
MKDQSKKATFVEMTPAQAATVNGGRRGRGQDDGPLHDLNDDKGGGRRNDDGPGHT